MKKFKGILKYLKNFYIVVGVLALVWMLFFDQYNLLDRIQTQMQIQGLKEDLAFYKTEKERLENKRSVLEDDPEELERYARERYRMRKANEDVFLIEPSPEK